MQRTLSTCELARDLAVRDLTDESQGTHALQALIGMATTALAGRWSATVRLRRGERIVSVDENYDRLGFSDHVVTREARYTRYIDGIRMLRSHTTAIVPGALEELAHDDVRGEAPDDVLLACPGMCYRRDSIDWQHTATPHQLDLWRLARRRPLGGPDLDDMIDALCGALVPGRPYRCEPRLHPYTLDGRQIDVNWDGTWVELAECGLAKPELLRRCGLSPQWSGLALGMGLDRLLMLVKGVPDVRLLRTADARVSAQMADLEPYRPVSAMPPVRRDLSVAVPEDDLVEDLGDRVRDALGADADVVEEVAILSSTPAGELPETASRRLGIRPGQVNLLVRVTLRALDRTLNDREANDIRNRVYAAIHRGATHEWATSGPGSR
jgi:phenylalanyl-tRNA synthetase alpha chain